MVSTPNVTYQKVKCSWCGYQVFYPIPGSELVCTCASCGEFKSVEDQSEQLHVDLDKIK